MDSACSAGTPGQTAHGKQAPLHRRCPLPGYSVKGATAPVLPGVLRQVSAPYCSGMQQLARCSAAIGRGRHDYLRPIFRLRGLSTGCLIAGRERKNRFRLRRAWPLWPFRPAAPQPGCSQPLFLSASGSNPVCARKISTILLPNPRRDPSRQALRSSTPCQRQAMWLGTLWTGARTTGASCGMFPRSTTVPSSAPVCTSRSCGRFLARPGTPWTLDQAITNCMSDSSLRPMKRIP